MEPLKKKRKSFTLKQKVEIIESIEAGKSQQAVAVERNLPSSTVHLIWKTRDQIRTQFKNSNPKLKKLRKGSFQDVDSVLYQWFREQRSAGIPLDGPLIQAKARFFAEALGIANFSASNGWFDKWKRRFDIHFQKLHGEAASAPTRDKENWLDDKWPVIRAGYSPEDIYNADETGLFFKMLPNATYNSKFDVANGKKLSKERVTVLVCANMTGTDKLPLLIIGKSARPRNFPKNLSSLPVTYRSNKKAWMTGMLWEEWIRQLDSKFGKEKRKVLLLIDNCSAHVEIPHLKNIQIEYFPPNVTSLLQPMDQGVIRNFKAHYRRTLIEKLLNHLEQHQELLIIKLVESVFMAFSAWQSVTATTIKNCFHHGGLCSEEEEIQLLDPTFDEESEAAYRQLMTVVGSSVGQESMEDYLKIDSELPICEQRSEESILEEFHESRAQQLENSGSEDEAEILSDVQPPVDIFKQIEGVRQWAVQLSVDSSVYFHLAAIERLVIDEKVRNRIQSKITDYFPPTPS